MIYLQFKNELEMICFQSSNAIESPVPGSNRTERFLFDTLFGLEVPSFTEEEEDDTGTRVKNCTCGE